MLQHWKTLKFVLHMLDKTQAQRPVFCTTYAQRPVFFLCTKDRSFVHMLYKRPVFCQLKKDWSFVLCKGHSAKKTGLLFTVYPFRQNTGSLKRTGLLFHAWYKRPVFCSMPCTKDRSFYKDWSFVLYLHAHTKITRR
jgi:hypothetical protein